MKRNLVLTAVFALFALAARSRTRSMNCEISSAAVRQKRAAMSSNRATSVLSRAGAEVKP